eukprot:6324962-Alexandrium_andersonii.AAC.1
MAWPAFVCASTFQVPAEVNYPTPRKPPNISRHEGPRKAGVSTHQMQSLTCFQPLRALRCFRHRVPNKTKRRCATRRGAVT